jgi:hypothetical protein
VRKTLIAILTALVLVVIPVGTALAATTADVTVTATPSFISITNAPSSWPIGVVEAGLDESTGETNFTITNDSTIAIDTTIECDGWGTQPDDWTYGASGPDQGQLNASNGSVGYPITVPEVPSGSPADLHDNVPVGTDPQWGLELDTPSSFSFGAQQSTIVTISAVPH